MRAAPLRRRAALVVAIVAGTCTGVLPATAQPPAVPTVSWGACAPEEIANSP